MPKSTITSPATGIVVPLAEIADAVFSSGVLGSGVGIAPESPTVTSPVDGELVSALPHAFGIRSDDGAEVLVHVGLDTVELDGAHFESLAVKGDRVLKGAPLTVVDFDAVRAAGYDTTVIVVVTNSAVYDEVAPLDAGHVEAGDHLISLAS